MPFVSRKFSCELLAFVLGLFCAFGALVPAHAQTYTDLHDFNAAAGDPTNFNSGRLAQARDGNFYTESRSGGSSGQGAVFNVSPSGTVSTIFSFDVTTGAVATGGITLGPSDGELYGDTLQGGTSGDGVTFKITTSGTFTALHNFTNTGDGAGPVNALVVGSNGDFYGLTATNPETFYSVTSAGKL
ncbi:MAG TPA: choice-of-anchor tandem repeat GloVer-containing protein, partial [Terriglobales bacterium]